MKTTLQTRLITLLVLSSLFLISTFTAIQLNNQVQKTREFNIYESRQEALVASEKLHEIFATYDDRVSHAVTMAATKNVFRTILEGGVIETVSLLNKDGHPVILEGNLQLFFEENKSFVEGLLRAREKGKLLTPVLDKDHKLMNMFIAFDNPYGYILKLTFSLGNIQTALNAVYIPVIFTVLIVIIGNIILGALLSWAVISPVKVLNEATKDVANGNLDLKIHISTKDELEELSDTFNYMTVELKKMKIKAENANPLTKLPGNIVIQEEVEKRIMQNKKFVLIYCDLDNFKAFNDKYGVHAGDEAIMMTANILKDAVMHKGAAEDFMGHEGGDDFLLLTAPERADKIASYTIKEFDSKIRKLYSKEDLVKGYIEARARGTNEVVKFPVMTISLAGVSNLKREITSYAQLTNIAAEVKKAAKKHEGSKFIMDRRIEDAGIGIKGKNE